MIDRLPARIAAKIEVAASGCWLWIGYLAKDGYGHVRVGDSVIMAHRAIYELLVGPITTGAARKKRVELHHDETCPRNCVNPAHLTPVVATEHRQLHRPTHCRKGHELTPDNSYVPKDGQRRCRTCIRKRRNKNGGER